MAASFVYAIKYVGNMLSAIRFYREELGLVLRFESPEWTEFDTGSTTLALHLASAEHPVGSCELGFRVPDVDAFYASKSGKGVDFVSPPTLLHGQKLARFKDIEGVQCSLSG